MADQSTLHPAEHRAYRELYVSARQLIRRWRRLAPALEGTPVADALWSGLTQVEELVRLLGPRTASYGLHGGPMAQGVGARIADLRTVITDRGADTGFSVRFAVLDLEHLTTLLRHLAELARARSDHALARFDEEWASRLETELDSVREAAVKLGTDPDRTAAPLSGNPVNRAAHGVGWVFGSIGEATDRVIGRRRSSGS
jgi:hypothetical protein